MSFDIVSYAMGQKSGGSPGPGPSPSPEPVPITGVNFIDDYTGEVVYSYTKAEFLALTELPANPVHEGLTSQGWNWTLADAKTQVQAMDYLDIGQMYVPTDGKTHMKVRLFDGRLSPYCGFAINGTAVIDWGDGSNTDTVSGSSTSTIVYTQHTYAAPGDYEVTIDVTSGTANFKNVSSYSALWCKSISTSSTASQNMAYDAGIQQLHIGSGVSLDRLSNCPNLSVLTLPASVAELATSSAVIYINSCGKLNTCSIPAGIPRMPSFDGCSSLSHISLPKSINSWSAESSFANTAIETISIPAGLSSLQKSCFSYARNFRGAKFPSGITSIPDYSFRGTAIESFVAPEGVTKIGDMAFYNCPNLKEITLPTTLTQITGENTFGSLPSLERVNISDIAKYCAISMPSSYATGRPLNNAQTKLYLNGTEVKDLVIPSGVTSVGVGCFYNGRFESVTFPDSLTTIGASAFAGCNKLKSATFGSGITTIGNYAFGNCDSLKNVVLPNGVTTIGNYAFSDTAITEMLFPDTVTSLGYNVCYSCKSLKKVKLPSGLAAIPSNSFSSAQITECIFPTVSTTIGNGTFSSAITTWPNGSFTIPDNVTAIGDQACIASGMTKVTIGSSVTSIGAYAFQNCYRLGEIHFKPTTPPTVSNVNAWSGIPTDCKIYVPTGTLSAYTSASKYPSSSTYTYIEE